jgi:SAM-dependent methyltransferase
MATDNAEQIAEWNGLLGQTWAERQREIDAIIIPFGRAALKAAAPQPGERVVDIGCGCGDTTIEIARLVGADGAVLGVDVSRPMLEVARRQGADARISHLDFREADASQAALPSGFDLMFSRFGVMFFADPLAAFRHLRKALRTGGRCVFVCWRAPRDNPWAMAPLAAAREAMHVTPPPADAAAPGPFAFADSERVRAILADAGFADIVIERFDVPIVVGATPHIAAERALRLGPTARLLRELGALHQPVMQDAVERAFTLLAAPDGRVLLNGSAWIVSATSPESKVADTVASGGFRWDLQK